jgi:hypothetical protein
MGERHPDDVPLTGQLGSFIDVVGVRGEVAGGDELYAEQRHVSEAYAARVRRELCEPVVGLDPVSVHHKRDHTQRQERKEEQGAERLDQQVTRFTVTFPHGLSLLPSTGTLREHWNDASFTCTRQTMHRIGCHTNTPFAFVSPHFGHSTLVEDRALVMKVRENKVKKLPVTVGATDELQILTHIHVIAPIKN